MSAIPIVNEFAQYIRGEGLLSMAAAAKETEEALVGYLARVPTDGELLGENRPGRDKDPIGAIRSAHCDNNLAIARTRPTHIFSPPQTGPENKMDRYYLWMETLTTFITTMRRTCDI